MKKYSSFILVLFFCLSVCTGTVTADALSTQIVRVLVGSDVYGTVIVPKNGTAWSVAVALPQSVATTFKATSADEAGNVSADSNSVVITENVAAGQGNGSLAVTSIQNINSTMTADNTFVNGGSWKFLVTIPTDQTNFSMKFLDWVSGANSIATGNNVRIYSAQSSNATASTSAITITGADTYNVTPLSINGDLDPATAGRQIEVIVDLKVPVSTAGGSYSTSYRVKSAI